MDAKLRGYIAELVGVFLIVFLGGAAVCTAMMPTLEAGEPRAAPWGIAIAEGCALAAVLPIVYRESPGCLNPAITLALWVCKRLDLRQTGILIGVQLVGSVLAGMALRAIFPEKAIRMATPHIDTVSTSTLLTAIGVEGLLTFALTFGVFGLLIDPRAPRVGSYGIGLLRCAVVIAGFELTGAAANPARWFGPFVWQFTVDDIRRQSPWMEHPPYWLGPILGAVAAGILYSTYILPTEPAKESGK
jgi:glycerol uptake facilitator-like aquaporin